MKKINSIRQLNAEKKRIRLEGKNLEKDILDNWDQLKHSIRTTDLFSLADNGCNDHTENKMRRKTILRKTVNYALELVVNGLLNKAEDRWKRKV